ncbi:MAG: L,D-transpeptidase [Hyphomicrobiales bacterium]|nr:L,D-transpeptidase [Hyphomicrobiales bacterium]
MDRLFALALLLAVVIPAANAKPLVVEDIENAEFQPGKSGERNASLLKAQILLSRGRISPGVIDGLGGSNTEKAIAEFERREGLEVDGKLDKAMFEKLIASAGSGPVLRKAEISKADTKGPFAGKIPAKLEDKADLARLAYTSVAELLGEKYHTDSALLKELNPGQSLDDSGAKIMVPAVDRVKAEERADRIEADKTLGAVRVFDKENKLLAFYPATIGSNETPSPQGELTVTRVVKMPGYTYDLEKLDFKGVKTKQKFEIAAGPNNPVGTIWIDLDQDGYGIHGTPEPSEVSKNFSNGCVRLTNWDAQDLATMVKKGVRVAFTGDDPAQTATANR